MPYKDPEKAKEWEATRRDKDKKRQSMRRTGPLYYASHLEYYAGWREAHRDEANKYASIYRRNDPDRQNNYRADRRGRKREAFVESVDRRVVFERDAGVCGECWE